MIHIAVCDDNLQELEQIRILITNYLLKTPALDAKVHCFTSSYLLLDAIDVHGSFDLYFLDILMPHINGIDAGKAIRDKDRSAVIIYLTSSKEYALESYQVGARQYLLKPIKETVLYSILDEIVTDIHCEDTKWLLVKTPDKTEALPLKLLLYAESYKHHLLCVMQDGRHIESITLRQGFDHIAAPLLEDTRFLKISASCAVNMHYICAVTKKGFLMSDKTELPITRRFSDARQKYIDYILNWRTDR